MTTDEADRLIDILDNLHLARMDVRLAARRLGLTIAEVEVAREFENLHTRELLLVRIDRLRRGVPGKPLKPLDGAEFETSRHR